MKTGFYPIMNAIISNTAIVFCFIPLIIVVWKKLQYERNYTIIGLYWLIMAILNQYNWLGIDQNWEVHVQLMFARNLVGIHFAMIIFLLNFNGIRKKAVLYGFLLFVLLEFSVLVLNGFNHETGIIVNGIGAFLVLAFSLVGLAFYFKEIEHCPFENSMAFVYAAFLFSYGSVAMIYLLNFLKVSTVNDPNEFFLYYVGLLLGSMLTCFGLWHYPLKPFISNTEK